jgi:hypothetical protein
MTIIPVRCRQCGAVEDLVSIIQIGPDRIRISNIPPKQQFIRDPRAVAKCHKHGEIWCWACWSVQHDGPLPDYYNLRTGCKLGRGEATRGGHA